MFFLKHGVYTAWAIKRAPLYLSRSGILLAWGSLGLMTPLPSLFWLKTPVLCFTSLVTKRLVKFTALYKLYFIYCIALYCVHKARGYAFLLAAIAYSSLFNALWIIAVRISYFMTRNNVPLCCGIFAKQVLVSPAQIIFNLYRHLCWF